MCEPTTIAMVAALALSTLSTGAQMYGQKQQAEAQANYQQDLVKSQNEVARQQMSAVRQRQAQEAEATAVERERADSANRVARATAAVSAGESGVSGNSVAAMLAQFDRENLNYSSALTRQQQLNDSAANMQIQAIRTGAANNALNINAPIGQPNYLAAGLKLGAQAAGSYASYSGGMASGAKSAGG